jgi:hypothetical protein
MNLKTVIGALVAAASLGAAESASISHAGDLDTVYQAVLNQIKKDGAEIESASKDTGIKTAVTITGHYKQTGSYLELTFISDSASETTVRVAAYEEKRYKGLKTEPWSRPKLNVEQSEAEAAKLKQELGW